MKKYNLLLPIAGKAQRFLDAGYRMPKPLILANHKHVIDWALDSIKTDECNLIFIVRLDHILTYSIDKILKQKFGDDITIVVLDHITKGALETCVLAEKYMKDSHLPLLIYTPDVYFEPQFDPNSIESSSDGFLLTFKANSPDHSYCSYDENGNVKSVAEKEVISEQANVGVYYYKSSDLFLKYAKQALSNNYCIVNNEFYIAPMYNLMIKDGLRVTYKETPKMHVLGTPKTFEFFCDKVTRFFGESPIALAADHSGFEAKEIMKNVLTEQQIEHIDVGTYVPKSCDYFDYVSQSVSLINSNKCDYGISFCRSGQGMNIAANKHDGIISALVFDEWTAEMARRHNCANHFAIPGKYITESQMIKIVEVLKNSTFDGGRHFTRIDKFI